MMMIRKVGSSEKVIFEGGPLGVSDHELAGEVSPLKLQDHLKLAVDADAGAIAAWRVVVAVHSVQLRQCSCKAAQRLLPL